MYSTPPVSLLLRDRALLLTSSSMPTDTAAIIEHFGDYTGLIASQPAVTRCLQLRHQLPDLLVGQDNKAANEEWASPRHPHLLGGGNGLFDPTLRDVAARAGVDFVISPTGAIRAGDVESLRAAIRATNEADDERMVCGLPVEAAWLREWRTPLFNAIEESRAVVALSVVSQVDPYRDSRVADGLLDLARQVGHNVVLCRTDCAALQFVARGGLGAIIGCTTTQRHQVPPGARAVTLRRSRVARGAVFVPEIAEFRAAALLMQWFGADAPKCALPACCGRRLTDFDVTDEDDRLVLAAHNVRGILTLFADMIAHPNRMEWLRDHREGVQSAYRQLRADTGVSDIAPYGGAKWWLKQTD